ncbi:MAG: asparaginase [Comamonas sp.]
MPSKIVLIGTGGTIAGLAPDAANAGQYQAAQLSVQALLQGLPGSDAVPVEAVQLAQIDSKDMDDAVWRALLQACHSAMLNPEVRAVVITHGTDTIEETAWFLQECLGRLPKPVVLTCAMRPANALMPDGPQNLRDALAVATTEAGLPEVVVVADREVHAARWVQKIHPHRLQAFGSGEQGPAGWVENGRVRWAYAAAADARPDYRGEQAVQALAQAGQPWPWVEVVTSHAGARTELIPALLQAGVQGLVLACTGNGTLHQAMEAGVAQAHRQGVPVWRSSRCALGQILEASPAAEAPPASALSAVKARVSLQLRLLGL